jgi:translocon-associated protein subunit alpha
MWVSARFENLEFTAGEPVEVLVGFRNKGSRQYNITFIDASFNFPQDFSYYIQNVRGV